MGLVGTGADAHYTASEKAASVPARLRPGKPERLRFCAFQTPPQIDSTRWPLLAEPTRLLSSGFSILEWSVERSHSAYAASLAVVSRISLTIPGKFPGELGYCNGRPLTLGL
jgi:hypothetical protein